MQCKTNFCYHATILIIDKIIKFNIFYSKMAETFCLCFSQKFGITLITAFMLFEALFMLNSAIQSTGRSELISFVDWGCFTADAISVLSLLKAIMNDTRENRKQANFSIVTATFIMIILIGLRIAWIFIDFNSAYPYMRHKSDKETQRQNMIMGLSVITSIFTFLNTYFYLVTKSWANTDPSEEI